MTNKELQKIMNNPNGLSSDDIDRIWADMKARDARREAKFNALPEEERKRLEKELIDPSQDRFGEDPLGDDDDN